MRENPRPCPRILLPDFRIGAVIKGVAVALLAVGDHGIPAVVPGPDRHHVLPGVDQVRNVEGKGHVSALVAAADGAVYRHGRQIVHRAEVQLRPPRRLGLGQSEATPVPYGGHEIQVSFCPESSLSGQNDTWITWEKGASGAKYPRSSPLSVRSISKAHEPFKLIRPSRFRTVFLFSASLTERGGRSGAAAGATRPPAPLPPPSAPGRRLLHGPGSGCPAPFPWPGRRPPFRRSGQRR